MRYSNHGSLVALGALGWGLWAAASCSASSEPGSGGKLTGSGGATGTGLGGGATATGLGGDGVTLSGSGGGTGSGGAPECGRQDFNIAPVPVDMLLVLDRSASMEDDPSGGSSTPSKWEILVPALQQAITSTNTVISWGLKAFPEGEKAGSCTTASSPVHILVPIAPNNAATVSQAISGLTDHGDGTPTGDAINNAVAYLKTVPDQNAKYLLLATDGDPSCPSSNAAQLAVDAVTAAAAAGYKTFVIGVAAKASSIKNLNNLAVAGLEPVMSPDPTASKFYLASDQATLVAALQSITGAAATCVLPLSSVPPAPDHVRVDVGGMTITKDPTNQNGWDYTGPDMMTIQLFGAACDQVKSSGVSTVQVTFGCKNDPVI
jgi:hypothetical protein